MTLKVEKKMVLFLKIIFGTEKKGGRHIQAVEKADAFFPSWAIRGRGKG